MPPHVSFAAVQDSYVHDQGSEGTCYAHTISTIIADALRRTAVESIPPRSTILAQTIARFGTTGANTERVLRWAVSTFVNPVLDEGEAAVRRLHSDDEVEQAIREDEAKVAMTFHLSRGQMDRLTEFFQNRPMGILSNADLGAADGPPRAGHAVVVEDLDDYVHGGAAVPSHHFWRFKNSWGVLHGALGSAHVARNAFPMGAVKFYVVDVPTPRMRFRDLFLEGEPVNASRDLRRNIRVDHSQDLGSGTFGTIYRARVVGAGAGAAAREIGVVVKCFTRRKQWPSLRKEMRHLFSPMLRHRRIVAAIGATKDAHDNWGLVLRRYDRGSLSHPRSGSVASADLPLVAHDVALALAHVHSAGFIHGDVKDSNVLLEVQGARVRGVLADFGCVQRADEPQKDTRLGTSVYRDPRVRSGDYGTEVDVYSLGKLLQSVAGRISTSQLNGQLMQMHVRCTHRLPSLRPSAAELAQTLAEVAQLGVGATGAVRPAAPMDHLLALVDATRANRSRAGDTGSDLRTVGASAPAPRPPEWDTTDAPSGVDRDNLVYVSRSKYHHRLCPVVRAWHHSGNTRFEKRRFADIAHRVTFKPCTRCAHLYKFSFNVFSGLGLHRPALDRPAPYPIDNIGRMPQAWMVQMCEPTGDPRRPNKSYLGPIYSNDGPWAARTAALRNLCEASGVYEMSLAEPEANDYEETPKGPEGSHGLTVRFTTQSGDAVEVRVRRAELAASKHWASEGDGVEPGEDDEELEEMPRIVFHWPGWGKLGSASEDHDFFDDHLLDGQWWW